MDEDEKDTALIYMLAVKGDLGENPDNVFSLLYLLMEQRRENEQQNSGKE